MKVHELRSGDKFKSFNIPGEGICIAHKIYYGNVLELAIIWEDTFGLIDKFHFWWNRECKLVSSGNDVSEYQKNLKVCNIEL